MNCLECRGACCETFTVEIQMNPPDKDAQRWLELHATVEEQRQTFECRCRMLTSEGLCSIWEDRPFVCELFIAGSDNCLAAVKSRRKPQDYLRIREDEDPIAL